jgi:hypothetical protein
MEATERPYIVESGQGGDCFPKTPFGDTPTGTSGAGEVHNSATLSISLAAISPPSLGENQPRFEQKTIFADCRIFLSQFGLQWKNHVAELIVCPLLRGSKITS